jgi:hypothetical protein
MSTRTGRKLLFDKKTAVLARLRQAPPAFHRSGGHHA